MESYSAKVLSYVGGKNCKVFRLPKFWRMPKPGRGGWVKNKSIAMRWRAIALVDGDPKRMRCKISNFGAEEDVGVLS
jgi:hypothetical protein